MIGDILLHAKPCTSSLCKVLFFASSQANTTTYTASDMCGSAANDFGYIDPGNIHHAKMDK